MSYGLKFFRIGEGVDPVRLYHEIERREESGEEDAVPQTSAGRLQMRRIATALKHWRPSLLEFVSNEPLAWIELDDTDLQIQFVVRGDHVNATIPYFGDRPRQTMEAVIGCAEVLREIAHYSAFDPQLESVVTRADLDNMVGAYTRVDRSTLLDVAETAARHRPWWRFW